MEIGAPVKRGAYFFSNQDIDSYRNEFECTYDGKFPDRLKAFGKQSITYNEKGLPNNYLGKSLEWSAIGQLTKLGTTEYIYDGYGKRVKKGDTVFTYDFGGRIIKQSNGLEFFYDGNGLSGLKFDGINYIYRKNAQGDITHILDNSGNIVVKYKYDAWGNHEVHGYTNSNLILDTNNQPINLAISTEYASHMRRRRLNEQNLFGMSNKSRSDGDSCARS